MVIDYIGDKIMHSLRSKINLKIFFDLLFGFISIIILLFYEVYYFKFFVDDAYISLHYAQNLANYGKIFFNKEGQPVEAYSNFLWILIASIFVKLNLDPMMSMKIFGIILSIGNLFLIYNLSKFFSKNKKRNIFPVFFTCIIPYYGIWAIAGLETQLYILNILIISSCIFSIFSKQKIRIKTTFLFLSIGLLGVCFTRIEGIFIYLICQIFLLFNLISHKSSFNRTFNINNKLIFNIFLIIFVGFIYLIYSIWRISYFGNLFPLSFYMKSSDLNAIKYNFNNDFMDLYPYISLFIIISFFKLFSELIFLKKKIILSRSFLFSLIFFIFFIALLTGDWMLGFRFYLPAIILLFIYSSSLFFFFDNNIKFNLKNFLSSFRKLLYSSKKKDISKLKLKAMIKHQNIQKMFIYLNQINGKFIIFGLISLGLFTPFLTDDLGRGKQDSSQLNFYYFRMQKNIQVGLWINKYYPNSTIAIDDFAGTVPFFSKCDIYEFRFILTDRHVVFNQTLREDHMLLLRYILGLKPDFFYDVDGISLIEKELRTSTEFMNNYQLIISGLYIRNDIELNQDSLENLPEFHMQYIWKPFLNEY